MGRHKQPREVADLKSANKVHPERYRDEVPKSPLPLGDAPNHLKPGAKACWFEISSYAVPGVLTGADRIMLEMASVLLANFRGLDVENLEDYVFPSSKMTHLIGLLARFGMSPADRQKLSMDKPDKGNPFDDF